MIPKGFRAAAAEAQMRYRNRPDLGLIVADEFQASAGVFTQNVSQAAPVTWSKNRIAQGRAILVNAGQANAQTGRGAGERCQQSAAAVARSLNLKTDEVLLASTGIIGQPLNIEALVNAVPALIENLSPEGFGDFSRAIMTTDTVPKEAETVVPFNEGPETSIWGTAKGSGMIAPNMATMLGFILTDAAVEPKLLRTMLSLVAENTFNRITVDGDTSTNDSLFIIASGASGRPVISGGPEADIFRRALYKVMDSLSRQLIRDGEGATHLVEIKVRGAKTQEQALMAARAVAQSPLVKTAFFGGDANWGRILAALGRSGADFEPYRVDIDIDELAWVRHGLIFSRERDASLALKKKEYCLTINLNNGPGQDRMLTCDFSYDYVKINGSYRS
ncbi:MAG: bifunctional glutamate N-acetyltransferase/amino-acid acetyltransferase ArgJ [Deltaproteobacteria bacterium]|jgi:glutamate N-acetyltransferase/amino-acid N-acetyltransferase|nr:bifunctional glutamate N-acetyltransferase/amino-acid acetyltransferase ArgJ [Deltaproteobacteria bacterium]